MRALIQRVTQASVTVGGRTTGAIGRGLLVLLGVTDSDGTTEAETLARKTARLRIFNDQHGKMNLCAKEVGGEALVVSQFTLYADTRKGNRPSFLGAANPQHATELYRYFMKQLEAEGLGVASGEFGAMMNVHLTNEGPVTIWLDTAEL